MREREYFAGSSSKLEEVFLESELDKFSIAP